MRKKRLSKVPVVICLALLLALAIPPAIACAPAPAPTPTPTPAAGLPEVKWRYQNAYGPEFLDSQTMAYVLDQIYEESGGRFEITPYWEGDIVPPSEIGDAVSAGTIEMGDFCGFDYPKVPEAMIDLGVPCLWAFDDFEMWDILEELGINDIIDEAFLKQNMYRVGFSYVPPYPALLSTVPIYHPEDLKGLVVRAAGDNALIYETFGASTTLIPYGEMYMAQKLGTIDAMSAAKDDLFAMSLYEVTDYVILPDLTTPTYGGNKVINLDAWNSLPEEYQHMLRNHFGKNLWYLLAGSFQPIIQEVMSQKGQEEGGYEIIWWTEEDMAKVREVAYTKVWENFAAQSDDCARIIEIMKDYYGMA